MDENCYSFTAIILDFSLLISVCCYAACRLLVIVVYKQVHRILSSVSVCYRDSPSVPSTPSTGLPPGSLLSQSLVGDQGSPKVPLNKRRSDSQLQLPSTSSESTDASEEALEKSVSHQDIPSSVQPSFHLRCRLPVYYVY